MKTWRICLFALTTIVAVFAEEDTASTSPSPVPTEAPLPDPSKSSSSDSPTPPTELDVAHLSSTSVFLYWKWTEDEQGLAHAKFNVIATPEGGVAKTLSVEGKLFTVLDALQANKIYSIQVALVKTDGTSLPSDPRTVQLKEKDFLRPTIRANTAGEEKDLNSVTYTTTWIFKEDFPSLGGLTGYEVLYCKSACDEQLANKGEFSSAKKLDYYSDYTVLVAARIGDASGGEVKLASPISAFRTVTGQPGRVENLNVDQKPDTLDVEITWSPPSQPNGEIESYSVQILKGEKIIISDSVKVTTYTYSIKTKDQVIESFDLTVQAINNGDDGPKNGVVVKKPYELKKPEPPTELKLKTCETDSIGIEIVRSSDVALKFRVVYASNQEKLLDSKEMVLNGFQTYQEVPVSVSACLPLDGANVLCGVAKDETFWTNVEAPTNVRDLKFAESEAKLTWKEPEKPGGPINGYVVRITDKSQSKDTEAEVQGAVPGYTFTEMKNCTKYAFYVFAYNNDVLSGVKKNGTLSDLVSYTSLNCDDAKGFSAWAIVLIVLVLLGAAGGGAFYYFKVYRKM